MTKLYLHSYKMTKVSLSSEKENMLMDTKTCGKEPKFLGITWQILGHIKKIYWQSKLATQRRAKRKALKNGKVQRRGKGGRWNSENFKKGHWTFIFRSELIRFLLKESYNLDVNTLENSWFQHLSVVSLCWRIIAPKVPCCYFHS